MKEKNVCNHLRNMLHSQVDLDKRCIGDIANNDHSRTGLRQVKQALALSHSLAFWGEKLGRRYRLAETFL